jgi:hypothetical protein
VHDHVRALSVATHAMSLWASAGAKLRARDRARAAVEVEGSRPALH